MEARMVVLAVRTVVSPASAVKLAAAVEAGVVVATRVVMEVIGAATAVPGRRYTPCTCIGRSWPRRCSHTNRSKSHTWCRKRTCCYMPVVGCWVVEVAERLAMVSVVGTAAAAEAVEETVTGSGQQTRQSLGS